MKNRKEGKNKRTRERDKERESEKGEAQKRLKRNKGKHRRMNNNKCLFWCKNRVFLLKNKERKAKK